MVSFRVQLVGIIAVAVFAVAMFAVPALAQTPKDGYAKGTVLKVVEEGTEDLGDGFLQPYRVLTVRIEEGPEKDEVVTVTQYGEGLEERRRLFGPGDKVIVGAGDTGGVDDHYIFDAYRLPALAWILAIFLALAVIFGGIKGLTSVIGLGFSIAVLVLYVVPNIMAGRDPLIISITGAAAIAVIAVYLAHGFNRRTTVAVASIILTLIIASALAVVFVAMARLTGLGSEEAFYLQMELGKVDLRGLLLGGIILGALGVLDDVATAQVASVAEIRNADPSLGFRELYRRGRTVGIEHIASLVNTLALAYMGASLPLFLLFSVNTQLPYWVIANGEIVAEEIVRTLVGSVALVCAVPISTALAAYVLSKYPPDDPSTAIGHAHRH